MGSAVTQGDRDPSLWPALMTKGSCTKVITCTCESQVYGPDNVKTRLSSFGVRLESMKIFLKK